MSATGAVLARPPVASGGGAGLLPQLLLALVCGGYATGALLGWGSPRLAVVMGDFGLSAAAFGAAVSCFWYGRTRTGRCRPAWTLFAVSSAMAGLGNAVWGWYEVVAGRPVPAISAADFCFVLFAPPAIVGLLVLAKRPVNRAGWVCLGLDAWLIAGSLLTLCWSLALAHRGQIGVAGAGVPRTALSLAYPLLDIVLVSLVIALHRGPSGVNRSAINIAIGALALTVLCDALFTLPALREHYRSGEVLDAGWFAGSVLLGYAPWAGSRRPAPRRARRAAPAPPAPAGRPISGSLAALAPYLAAGVCTLSVLYNVLDRRPVDATVIITACAVVLALVIRQAIMLMDNLALTQELAQKENHFRSLVQSSSDVIMIAAPNGVLRYVSPAASGVYGRDADELVGTGLASHIHPEDLGAVMHEVRRFLASPPGEEPTTRIECRFRSGTGEWLNVESTINRHHGGLILNSRDVTERVRLQAQLQHNAEHDPLTDLPNRALFTKRVRHALAGRRRTDAGTAVLYIDLDGFKAVNDTVGHQAGDELLVQAARRLQESVRSGSGDCAARLGGDEFAALITGDGEDDPATRECRILEIADRLRVALSQPYVVEGGTEVRVAASIGVAFAEPGTGPGALMRNADLAMYRAKSGGKNRVELYAPQMQAEVERRAELATRLRTALNEGEFVLLHQPIADLATGRIAALAAQPRWRSAQGILFTPAEFLRVASGGRGGSGAEEAARTAELSRWTLQEAVEQAARRRQAGHPVPVVVRLPASRLVDRSMPARGVENLLARHGLPSGSLILELTDSDPRVPLEELEHRLGALRRLGVRIALDGFGSGYAAIRALRRLPVDILKLDCGLVEGVVESSRLHKITSGLLRIAGDLGMQSVAEGVDMPEQIVALRAMGCTHAQGMAFSGPLDEPRLRRALARGGFPVPRVEEPVLVGGALPVRHPGGGHVAAVHPGVGHGGVPHPVAPHGVPHPVAPHGGVPHQGAPHAGRRADGHPHTPLRSNAETPVPPT
ncbi:EAL domain-containing protein [Streptomyces pactum]|uniref:EAL domain-containing protein n=1 Tax=Streptomyces pactum TaxID=68249 RepID=A0ABS0NPL7_9ACTN|nr:EAL domain-containing protein [Streptomyces pactum]MBH5337153.1 EAL domain-containing protein [Streptomyces pactum]